jgi:hypothetical protein
MGRIGNHQKAAVLLVGFLLVATGGSSSTAPRGAAAVWSKNDTAIKKAMHGIHSDLKKLKFKFFQLRYIEDAKVYNNEFRYTTGLQRDSKTNGPTFSKYGCDIYVHIQYPATQQDIDQSQLAGTLVSLKNGTAYAVWKLTRTEPTQEGQEFADEVNKIVTARLDAMKRELEQA